MTWDTYNLALDLFTRGKQKEGWHALLQARKGIDQFKEHVNGFDSPIFEFQSPPAKIYIHSEGGYGDNFALLRYILILHKKGYVVEYGAVPTVAKLVTDSMPYISIRKTSPDYSLSTIDLPVVFDTDIDSIPWDGPYLKADPYLVSKYKGCRGKVGVCWNSGLKGSRFAMEKSIEFSQLKPLIGIDPSLFVAVQQGESRLDAYRTITDCLPRDERTMTWADTAALIENLDLVISIDTAVAHLAGAMGKPVWLMMHKSITSWQFMGEWPGFEWNEKSPWYPTMRIFRQKEKNCWNDVVSSVASALVQLNSKQGSYHGC